MRYPGQFNRAAYDPLNPYAWQPYAHYADLPEEGTTVTPPQLNKVKDEIEANIDKIYADINEINRINYEDHPPAIVGMVEMYWGNTFRLPPGWSVCDGGTTDPDRELFKNHGTTHKPNFIGRYPKGSTTPLAPAQTAPTTYKIKRDQIPWKPLTITYGTQNYTSADALAGTTPTAADVSTVDLQHQHNVAHTHTIAHNHTITHSHNLGNHAHSIAHSHTVTGHTHSMQGHTHSGPSHRHEQHWATAYNTSASGGHDRFDIRKEHKGGENYMCTEFNFAAPTVFGHSKYNGTGATGGPSSGSTGGASANSTGGSSATNSGTQNGNTGASSAANTGASSAANSGAASITNSGNMTANDTHNHTFTISHNYTETLETTQQDLDYYDPYHQEIIYIIYEGAIV